MRQAKYWILLPLLLVLTCVGVFAQSTVSGIITDQTGAVVAGAKIVLTDPATAVDRATVSGDTGLYSIGGLGPSDYNLKVSTKGFQNFVQNGIVVNVASSVRVDVKLMLGAETQTITVQADALAVQADSNVVSTLISEQQITELATNGRNIMALAALGLGTSGNLPDFNMPTSVGSNTSLSFNGLSWAHNLYLLDGGESYDRGGQGRPSNMISQDALGEFQVMASNYPPDYGISSGGTIVMSTKSGTQKFHGEAYEFVRNDAFQAHNYFDKPGAKKPELRMNIFGGNVGGPLYIPHMYNSSKKKTFFFVNEEWRKIVQGSSPVGINAIPASDFITSKPSADVTWTLPTYANRYWKELDVGKQLQVPTVAPGTALGQAIIAAGLTPGSTFPGNKIPAGLFVDSAALQFNAVGAIPKATDPTSDQVTMSVKQPVKVREDLFRIDHNINDKWQLFGHYLHDTVSQDYATALWGGGSYPTIGTGFANPAYSSVIKLTGTLSPNLLLEAAFNMDGNRITFSPIGNAYLQPSGWTGGSFFPTGTNPGKFLPDVNLSAGYGNFQAGRTPWKNAAFDYAEVFGLSYTHGKHSMKFGGGYNRYIKNQMLGSNTDGSFTISDGWTPATSTAPAHFNNPKLTGDPELDFVLGLTTAYNQNQIEDVRHYVNQTPSIYANDNWHVNSRLTLQIGFRYDALPHAWERDNRLSSFDPAQYQSASAPTAADFNAGTGAWVTGDALLSNVNGVNFYMNGITLPGQNGTPRGLVKNDYRTYQPRIGFSYDLSGNGKTVVRGGYGNFFERMQGNDVYNIAGNPPFANDPALTTTTFTDPLLNWDTNAKIAVANLPVVTQAMTTIAPIYKAPGVAQYSLGVQHEIVPSMVLVAQYVGNVAWHQNVQFGINNLPLSTPMQVRADYGGDKTTAGYADRTQIQKILDVTYPGFKQITEEKNIATGSYNSAQIGLRQQDRHGLSFEIDYTYGHEIDSQVGSQDLLGQPNPWNLRYGKGSGDLDRRQVLNANYVYKLPIFAHSTGLAHSVLGGWTLSGTFVRETGLPWAGAGHAAGSGYSDTIGLGGGYTNYADKTGSVVYPKTKDAKGVYQYVSGSAFSQPKAAWKGGANLGFGNSGRDSIVGPGRTNFSTNLYKSFSIRERAHFELRAESFNTFNHTQFNSFKTGLTGSDFGEVNGVQDPRTFEFAGKFVF